MKRLLTSMALLLSAFSLFAQNITLTFTGRDVNNQFITLSRVAITDVTQNWQESIFYPDTIYTTTSVGIEEHDGNPSFALSQNVPNPFKGVTDFSLQMPKAGKVQMEVNGLNGQRIATFNQELPAGRHTFRVQLSTPQGYVLNARCGDESASIKMLNTGNAGTNRIQYLGEGPSLTLSLRNDKGQGSHAFYDGDEMIYIGYVTVEGAEYQSNPIYQQQFASENFVLNFNLSDFGRPCPGASTLSDYDGNLYHTVQIGRQCWMKENLKTTHYSDGTAIALNPNHSSTTNPRYCYPSSDSSYVGTYGLLYNRKAAMRGNASSAANPSGLQGVCPDGWHMPSETEWTELEEYVSCQNQYVCGNNIRHIAKALASNMGWYNSSIDCAIGTPQFGSPLIGNNATGFSALPAGYESQESLGYETSFWTTTAWGGYQRITTFEYSENLVYHNNESDIHKYYFSVRCVKNDSTLVSPMVSTDIVTDVDPTEATCGGTVVVDSGAAIVECGICYATVTNPLIADAKVMATGNTEAFTCTLTGLIPTVTYYVRAYVTTGDGTFYGNQESFTTPAVYNENDGKFCDGDTAVTDYDGNVYPTVQIGQQCWMRENMRATHFSDGTDITLCDVDQYWSSYFPYCFCYYPNKDSSTVSTYGFLYNWPATMKTASVSTSNPSGVQGICPNGWHVPSNAEWIQLINYVSSQSQYACGNDSTFIGKALASTTGWNSSMDSCAVGNSPEYNNATGFSAVPAGIWDHLNTYPVYQAFGNGAAFWSTTLKDNRDYVYGYYLSFRGPFLSVTISTSSYKCNGASVRCLRD